MVSESGVTWATSVPILVFLGLSILDLGPMYATDVRQTSDVRQHHRLMPPPRGGGIISPIDTEKLTLRILSRVSVQSAMLFYQFRQSVCRTMVLCLNK